VLGVAMAIVMFLLCAGASEVSARLSTGATLGLALLLFVAGWVLQFIGHWFEGEPPEFFKDWRFLFVGLRWWLAKISGKA
jgi:uncharacterized membrane protein YGL010W